MEAVVLVEGDNDHKFFSLLGENFLTGKGLTVFNYKGKDNLKPQLRIHIEQQQISRIVATRDLDRDTPQRVIQTIESYLRDIGQMANVPRDQQNRLLVGETAVVAIPVGLYQDEQLTGLGISSHSVEDFLIKLAFGQNPDLTHNLEQLLSHLEQKRVTFPLSKDLFQFIKPLSGLPANDAGAIERLFRRSAPTDIEQLCRPLIHSLASITDEGPA